MTEQKIVPVILAGGLGTRLWPLSRGDCPKQLLPLINHHSLLQNTILRIQSIQNVKVTAPLIVCNEQHRFLIADQLQEIGIKATIILEPSSRNTAPAIAIAALLQKEENSIFLILPADHLIDDCDRLAQSIKKAFVLAKDGKIITFGVTPTGAETGYGYIKASKPLAVDIYAVESFIEKPEQAKAQEYLTQGNYYWNSGIFMFSCAQYLTELTKHCPLVLQHCQQVIEQVVIDLDFIRLNKRFNDCPNISIDYAVMEKTDNAVLIPINTSWSDIGSWPALHKAHQSDINGNVLKGDVHAEDVKNCYLHAENRLLTAIGLQDHIVIETSDVVLISHKDKCQEIKNVVTSLKEKGRQEVDFHKRVHRPWGYYEILHQSLNFQVKFLTIKPNAFLSLQMHHHRSEHWVVVEGTAQVTCGDNKFTISQNESTFIPKKAKHQLGNLTDQNVKIIEVQLGEYLGEDDIIRFEDVYGRAETIS